MHRKTILFWVGTGLYLAACLTSVGAGDAKSLPSQHSLAFEAADQVGRIESQQLVECSGIDTSLTNDDVLWAINDGGNGPYLYALGSDGRDRGRFRVLGAENRDWEGLATFLWRGEAMIMIADFGDNQRQYASHTLYVVKEPRVSTKPPVHPGAVDIAWKIVFRYPDANHDAEGLAVDPAAGEILLLTKRDQPPLLFVLSLQASVSGAMATARPVTAMNHIPEPSPNDRLHAYGAYRSQPTAIDLSPDNTMMAVLTYKHAYLFNRRPDTSWAMALQQQPVLIELPLPENSPALAQREAICFSRDGASLLVTSEGRHPGIFRLLRSSVR